MFFPFLLLLFFCYIDRNQNFLFRCLSYVRPYHGILLTKSEKELLNFLPLDSSPSLIRLIKLTTPVKNLKTLALETDLSLTQVGLLLEALA